MFNKCQTIETSIALGKTNLKMKKNFKVEIKLEWFLLIAIIQMIFNSSTAIYVHETKNFLKQIERDKNKKNVQKMKIYNSTFIKKN